jgi:hypothetical protein
VSGIKFYRDPPIHIFMHLTFLKTAGGVKNIFLSLAEPLAH